jgi:acetylornithine/LysW-gamma-L-lysine aminotransferase
MDTRLMEDEYEVDVYSRRDIVLTRGRGSTLFDGNDREYIDCASNMGVSGIGHGNETVARAIHDQYLQLGNCYGMFYNDVRGKLARKLAEISPGELKRTFFCNSGTEAVEAAIKFARATTGRSGIICALRGFHGKTMGSLAATWGPRYRKPFEPLPGGFVHVPFNDFEKLRGAVNDETAAVLLEVVQGEGGVHVGNPDYFKEVRELCDSRGVLLIIDEVQTGFGRTGSMFACENYAIPDMLCLAKSMAGGVPMGAVVCTDRIDVPRNSHTSTFGGNPLACAAALAAIEFMEEERLPEQAAEKGNYFMEALRNTDSPLIREVRGTGLMIGVELNRKAGPFVQRLMERGIIALLAGKNVIRFLPPLVISHREIDRVVETLGQVLEEETEETR